MEHYTSDPVALRMVARYHSAKLRALPYSGMPPSAVLEATIAHKAKLGNILWMLDRMGEGMDIRTPEAWR